MTSRPNTAIEPDSAKLVRRLGALYPAVVSDMLDAIGLRSQVMAPRVRPLFSGARVVGRAATVQAVSVHEIPRDRENHYKLQLEAIEALGTDDVMVTSRIDVCFWGELLSIAAKNHGATGIVIDGYTRDVNGIERLGFPVFCCGVSAADALGRSDVVDYGGTITSGEVTVTNGDFVIGDRDGVVVIPSEVVAEVIARAEEKATGEDVVRERLRDGMSVSEAFQRYGIL